MAKTDHDIELAWAAGFFDGEGSSGATTDKRAGSVTVTMVVVQSGTEADPPDTLLRFQRAVGMGTIKPKKLYTNRLGSKPMWAWRLYSIADVRACFELLRPNLGMAKLDQFAEAIALRSEYEGLARDRARFCKRGHEISERGDGPRRRRCWVCHNEYAREWKRRKRAEVRQGE